MSLAFLSKPLGGSKKDADPAGDGDRDNKPGPVRGGATTANVVVGGAPRVDLMPPEIRLKRSQLHTRRSLRLVLLVVFIAVVAACLGTLTLGTVAQTSLASAQVQQQQLLSTQNSFSEVTTIKSSIALIEAGQKVGDSTEIDWQDYLNRLQASLPPGVGLTTVSITAATPLTEFSQSTAPLQGTRIATLLFSATSPVLPSIPQWLDGLEKLPGFVDATPSDVTFADGSYSANVSMHINTLAFANRFDPTAAAAAKKANSALGVPTTTPTATPTPTPTPTAGRK